LVVSLQRIECGDDLQRMVRWTFIDSSGHPGRRSGPADPAGGRVPAAGVLVGACLWALGSAVAGAVVGMAALVAVAGDPPAWFPPSVLAVGTAAVLVAALLTVAVLVGIG
jgi:hypothetical protein